MNNIEKKQTKKGNEIMQYFKYEHLPEHLRFTSKAFCDLAWNIERNHQGSAEKSTVLRKLLEAKDAAVRSKINTNALNKDSNVMVNSPDGSHRI